MSRIKTISKYVAMSVAVVIIVVLVYQVESFYATDFRAYFYPATRLFWTGQNPYTVPGFYNPPWLLALLAPFALLPERWAQAAFFACALCALLLVCYKLRLGRLGTLAFLLSFPAVYSLLYGNLEWLVLLGLLLPPRVGVFFMLIKPQVGMGALVCWIVQAWRKRGARGVLGLLWPVGLAVLLSMAIYGPWPLGFATAADNSTMHGLNVSAWPWLLPLGFYLVAETIKTPDLKKSLLIGPALSPHLVQGSWCGLFIALGDRPVAMVLANVVMWWAVVEQMS